MSYGWQAKYDQGMTLRRVLLCAILLAAFTGVAHAKDYSAQRFDARVELLRGGGLRVTERVLVRFESGTFTQFDREIPGRLTDGIEVVSASLDGAVLPAGEVRGRSRSGNRRGRASPGASPRYRARRTSSSSPTSSAAQSGRQRTPT